MTETNPTILIVGDCAVDARIISEALLRSDEKYELIVANDGLEAIDYLSKRGKYLGHAPHNLRAIILDMNLPGRSGIEVLASTAARKGSELSLGMNPR